MISYELAKQLKDAGFSQFFPQDDEMEIYDAIKIQKIKDKYAKDVYIPTLSELIEACGESFGYLIPARDVNRKIIGWGVKNFEGNAGVIEHSGSTPEEAVANLYLETHKK